MSFGFELEIPGLELSFGDGLQELWKFDPRQLSVTWTSPSPNQYPVKGYRGEHVSVVDGQSIIFTSYSCDILAQKFLKIKQLILPVDYYGMVLDKLEFSIPNCPPIFVDLSYDGGHLEFRTSPSLNERFTATPEWKVFTRNLINQITRIKEMCLGLNGSEEHSDQYIPTVLLNIVYVPCVSAVDTPSRLQEMVRKFDFSTQTVDGLIKEAGRINPAWSSMIKSVPISVYVSDINDDNEYYTQTNASVPLLCFSPKGFLHAEPMFFELIEKNREPRKPLPRDSRTEFQIFKDVLINDLPIVLDSAGWSGLMVQPNCTKFVGMVGLILYYFQFLIADNRLPLVTPKNRFPLLLKSHFHHLVQSFTKKELEFWRTTGNTQSRFSKMLYKFLMKICSLSNLDEAMHLPTSYFQRLKIGPSRVVFMNDIVDYLSHLFEHFSKRGNFETLKTTIVWQRAQEFKFYCPAEHPIEFSLMTEQDSGPVLECRRHPTHVGLQDWWRYMQMIARCWEGFYRLPPIH